MLEGVFNERPPMARYSPVRDVGVVLHHLKHLGNNESLSLRLLTLKTMMLLVLTRPARSVDLSNLDIRFWSFTRDGVIFKARHLAKQARPSKPLADYSTQNIHKISISVQLPPYKSMRLEPWNSETCPLTAQSLPCFYHGLENTCQFLVVP